MTKATTHLAILLSCSIGVATLRAAGSPIAIDVPARDSRVDFVTEILPIFRANCAACHNDKMAESGLSLESPAAILKGGEQGPAAVAGKGAESLLLKVAAHQEESFMPPADNLVGAKSLTPAQLGLIKLWIDQGAAGTAAPSRDIAWQPLPPGFAPIFATAVTPDGQYAACSRGNRLVVYSLPSGTATHLVDPSLIGAGVDVAHRDVIRSLAFDASGRHLASGGFREVKLWRVPRVERLAEWNHDAAVSAVAAASDGITAATGDASGAIRLWDIKLGKTLHKIAAHKASISGLVFSSDGAVLYSASVDKSLAAWNVASGSRLGKPVETVSPPRAIVLIKSGEQLAVGEEDGHTRVWETKSLREAPDESPKPLAEIKTHASAVVALVALPNSPDEFLSAGEDGFVRRWKAESGKQLAELKCEGPVAALAATPDGGRIAAAGPNYVRLWNGTNGQPLTLLNGDPRLAAKVAEFDAQITFTKSAIALAKQDIKSYEGSERRVMTTAEEVKKAEDELAKVAKAREEKKQALEKATQESKDDKQLEAAKKALADAETSVAVAGTVIERAKAIAERAAKSFADEQKAVVDLEEHQKQLEAAQVAATEAAKAPLEFRSLALSTDGKRLAAGGPDGAIHFYDAATGAHAETLVEHKVAVHALAFASGGTLLSGAPDGRAVVWNATSEWQLLGVFGHDNAAESLADRVLGLDFSRDGRLLVTAGGIPSRAGELKIWNVSDRRLVREIPSAHADTIFAAKFSPDGKHLATASADRLVRVWNLESGEVARTYAGHTAHVLSVAWKGDGKQLVSSGADNMLKLWDFETGLPVRTMKGTTYRIGSYKGEVTNVAFIGASEQILAASGDGTVRLHRTTSENDILTFAGSKGYQYAVAATPDGRVLLSGGADGVLRLWSGQTSQLKQSLP